MSMTRREKEVRLRDLAARHGYKLRRRGKEYRTIDENGERGICGDLEAIAAHFEMIDAAKANGQCIQFTTACGMPTHTFDPSAGESFKAAPEQRATGSAEVSIEERRAQNAALDEQEVAAPASPLAEQSDDQEVTDDGITDLVVKVCDLVSKAAVAIGRAKKHHLQAGRLLLELRRRVEAGEDGPTDWWAWHEQKLSGWVRRKQCERLMRWASAADPEAAIEQHRTKSREHARARAQRLEQLEPIGSKAEPESEPAKSKSQVNAFSSDIGDLVAPVVAHFQAETPAFVDAVLREEADATLAALAEARAEVARLDATARSISQALASRRSYRNAEAIAVAVNTMPWPETQPNPAPYLALAERLATDSDAQVSL